MTRGLAAVSWQPWVLGYAESHSCACCCIVVEQLQ